MSRTEAHARSSPPQGPALSVAQSPLRPAPALQRLGDAVEPWLYSAPALVLITAVMLVPLVVGISYAFRDVQILNPFSGGFVASTTSALAGDEAFCGALVNTFWWTFLTVLIQLVLGLVLAPLLDVPFRGRGHRAGARLPPGRSRPS